MPVRVALRSIPKWHAPRLRRSCRKELILELQKKQGRSVELVWSHFCCRSINATNILNDLPSGPPLNKTGLTPLNGEEFESSMQNRQSCPGSASKLPPKGERKKIDEIIRKPTSASLVDILPSNAQPYARLIRLDRPWGSMLLMWPCFWSTALAAQPLGSFPDLHLLGLFATGSFVMRGAGCIINDMWDVEYDKNVERTQNRPLASGELNMTQASTFLVGNLLAGLGVLVSLPHTEYCVKLGLLSMPLVVAYPLMKRYTDYPQLVLGLTFNWGALMGWAAVHGSLDGAWWAVLPLYFSGVTWTLVYDTLYAHQDKIDDSKLGLKSTALTFGDSMTKPILHGFAAATMVGWCASGYYGAGITHPVYYIGMSTAYGHLTWQILTAELDNPSNLAERFRSNQLVGGIVFGSIVAGNLAMGL